MTDRYQSRATTHADGCWSWGRAHYECAVREIERLQAGAEMLLAERDSLAAALEADRNAVGSGLYVETVLRQFLTSDGYIAECDIPHIVAALTQGGRND